MKAVLKVFYAYMAFDAPIICKHCNVAPVIYVYIASLYRWKKSFHKIEGSEAATHFVVQLYTKVLQCIPFFFFSARNCYIFPAKMSENCPFSIESCFPQFIYETQNFKFFFKYKHRCEILLLFKTPDVQLKLASNRNIYHVFKNIIVHYNLLYNVKSTKNFPHSYKKFKYLSKNTKYNRKINLKTFTSLSISVF